jgi:Putative metallopeptidase family (DUF6782)
MMTAKTLRTLTAILLVTGSALAAGQVTRSSHPASNQALVSQADSVLKTMSRITSLPIKAPLKKRVFGRSEIRRMITAKLQSEHTPAELNAQSQTLKAFGLVPADFDLGKFLINLYTEQAAGFYDPKIKTMYIASWLAPDQQEMVLAHELTHALQDQNFDLQRYVQPVKDDDDASAARLAVVEGYATAAMIQEMIGSIPLAKMPSMQPFMATAIRQDPAKFPVFAKAPFFFRFESLFPYSQGLQFIQKDLARSDWAGLRALFKTPPQNTKQIFDPSAYFSHDPVAELDLPDPPAPSRQTTFHKVNENAFGELGYYCLLGQLISQDEAKSLAPAWAADRYAVYASPDGRQLALVARTVWSSQQKAAQFFRDYQTILHKKYGSGLAVERSQSQSFVASTLEGQAVVILRRRQCIFAEGISKSQEPVFEKWAASLKDRANVPGNQIASARPAKIALGRIN